ncbi:MAG TPA: NYN domain-containing protein [Thermoanaerobaculia bacterium]|nr:NYN domain-containing protein [Thermoanaerobaculia bacterium]
MAPWWLRPTADGAEESDREERQEETPQPPPVPEAGIAAPSETAAPAPAAVEAEGEEEPPAAAARTAERTAATEEPGREAAADAADTAEAPRPRSRGRRGSGRGRATPRAEEERDQQPAPEPRPAREERPQRDERRRDERSREAREERGWAAREERLREERSREELRPGDTVTLPFPQLQDLSRELVITLPERGAAADYERKLAVFCDLENVALGAKETGTKFDINLVLERLVEKGKIIVKRAYADWYRYSDYKRPFHEAGIELIDIPQRSYSGKNSADIKMVVDAMDLSYAKEHLDTFVLVSGDSDFSPLVSKLKENNKYVIGVGVKGSSSNLLIDNCDEFIYYEDIWRDLESTPKLDTLSKKEREVFGLLTESIQALVRENKDVLWGSMIKQTMQRKRPSFNEGYYGYSTFSDLLEDAEKKNIVKLKKDQRSGSYIVTGFTKRR